MPTGKDFDLNPSIEMMDELVGTQGRLVRSNSSSAKPTIRRNFTNQNKRPNLWEMEYEQTTCRHLVLCRLGLFFAAVSILGSSKDS
jgi:hypothetical protein